jgi:hypothetical protein
MADNKFCPACGGSKPAATVTVGRVWFCSWFCHRSFFMHQKFKARHAVTR